MKIYLVGFVVQDNSYCMAHYCMIFLPCHCCMILWSEFREFVILPSKYIGVAVRPSYICLLELIVCGINIYALKENNTLSRVA